MRISTLGRVAIALTHPPRKLTAAASQRQSHVPNLASCRFDRSATRLCAVCPHRLAMLPNVICEPQTSRGVYSPNSPKNNSMRYFNVSYHKNLLRLGAYCSPTPRLHALQVERILGMPRQQVIRGGGRLEFKSKGPGAGPGPSEVAYRNLPLSDDGRRGLALADARPAARDAQKSHHCCHCQSDLLHGEFPLSHDRGSLACNPALTSAERTHLHEIRRDGASRQITAAPLGHWRRGRQANNCYAFSTL